MTDQSGALVACVDGPLAGFWYSVAEWSQGVRASARMVAAGQRRSVRLDYAPILVGAPVENPVRVGLLAIPLAYLPETE